MIEGAANIGCARDCIVAMGVDCLYHHVTDVGKAGKDDPATRVAPLLPQVRMIGSRAPAIGIGKIEDATA